MTTPEEKAAQIAREWTNEERHRLCLLTDLDELIELVEGEIYRAVARQEEIPVEQVQASIEDEIAAHSLCPQRTKGAASEGS